MPESKISRVTNKVEDIKIIMHENIEKAAQNCVKLESIDRDAEELMKEAGVFKITAEKLKNKLWWKNIRIWLLIGAIIGAIILIVVAIYVSGNQKQ